MRKFIFLILLTGCITPQRIVNQSYLDFSKYDIYISESNYNGPYEPTGLIFINVYPGMEKNDAGVSSEELITQEYLLDLAVKAAKGKGANGIINLKIERHPTDKVVPYKLGAMKYSTVYTVTAMAIKI